MCVIIDRQPDITIPLEKLEIACDINKHGFGISFIEKGRLKIIQDISNNSAAVIGKELSKLGKHRVFLHLRHATVGAVTKENAHPFVFLNKKIHGVDAAFMHNGTLYDYRPSTEDKVSSDTSVFNAEMVLPLAARVHTYCGSKVLEDWMFRRILNKEVGHMSVVVVFDSDGRVLKFNESKGAKFEGWWASNDYSFQTTHVRSSTSPHNTKKTSTVWDNYGDFGWDDATGMPWWDDKDYQAQKKAPVYEMAEWEKELAALDTPTSQYEKKLAAEIQKAADFIHNATYKKDSIMTATGAIRRELFQARKSFAQQAQIKLEDIGKLTEKDLTELTNSWPEAASQLIIDLLNERHSLMLKNKNQADMILEHTAKKSNH